MPHLKIISYNLNGIRSALTKGLADWIKSTAYDIYLFQEIKADKADIPVEIFEDLGYIYHAWNSAEKKGYSGVGIISRIPIESIYFGMGIPKYDQEGRILEAKIGDLTIINTYFPSGSSGEERQAVKMEFLNDYLPWINEKKYTLGKVLVCGDYNICHHEIDIHNPKGNAKNSGFLPEERAWMTDFFNSGFIDTFRHINPDPHHYSWWSYRFNSRGQNKGWRIDYHAVSENLKDSIVDAAIFPDAKHSDHCPVYLELNI